MPQHPSVEYHVKRRRATRSVTIRIGETGEIFVSAPYSLSHEAIHGIVSRKSGWIVRQRNRIRELQERWPAKRYAEGERYLLLGRQYVLKVVPAAECGSEPVVGQDDEIHVFPPPAVAANGCLAEWIHSRLSQWYLRRAEFVIRERLPIYQKLTGRHPADVRINSPRRRWGSCSSSGILRFNWRIVMAPVPILDYILVHELAHLRFMNHSPDFWGLVGAVVPDYKEKKKWLRENEYLLRF